MYIHWFSLFSAQLKIFFRSPLLIFFVFYKIFLKPFCCVHNSSTTIFSARFLSQRWQHFLCTDLSVFCHTQCTAFHVSHISYVLMPYVTKWDLRKFTQNFCYSVVAEQCEEFFFRICVIYWLSSRKMGQSQSAVENSKFSFISRLFSTLHLFYDYPLVIAHIFSHFSFVFMRFETTKI